jgi:hypothetical protein
MPLSRIFLAMLFWHSCLAPYFKSREHIKKLALWLGCCCTFLTFMSQGLSNALWWPLITFGLSWIYWTTAQQIHRWCLWPFYTPSMAPFAVHSHRSEIFPSNPLGSLPTDFLAKTKTLALRPVHLDPRNAGATLYKSSSDQFWRRCERDLIFPVVALSTLFNSLAIILGSCPMDSPARLKALHIEAYLSGTNLLGYCSLHSESKWMDSMFILLCL